MSYQLTKETRSSSDKSLDGITHSGKSDGTRTYTEVRGGGEVIQDQTQRNPVDAPDGAGQMI